MSSPSANPRAPRRSALAKPPPDERLFFRTLRGRFRRPAAEQLALPVAIDRSRRPPRRLPRCVHLQPELPFEFGLAPRIQQRLALTPRQPS